MAELWTVLPVRRVLFPNQTATYAIGKRSSVATINSLLERLGLPPGRLSHKPRQHDQSEPPMLALVLLRAGGSEGGAPVYQVGTAARLLEVRPVPPQPSQPSAAPVYTIVVHGVHRLQLFSPVSLEPVLQMHGSRLNEETLPPSLASAYALSLAQATQELLQLQVNSSSSPNEQAAAHCKLLCERLLALSSEERQMSGVSLVALVDALAVVVDASASDKQEILASDSLQARVEILVGLLKRQLEVHKLSQKISAQVKGELSKSQREYYLRQQLKAIRDELGDGSPEISSDQDEIVSMASKISEAGLPKEANLVAERELKRLRQMAPQQAEYSVTMNYLEWVASLPWQQSTEDNLSLSMAEELLEREHHVMVLVVTIGMADIDQDGLAKVKRRVYEHLAVWSLTAGSLSLARGSILCLIGPPGVGKTSIGRSIARALGRKFEQIALGGVSDATEIRGHRRTYVGAMPGLVMQALRRARSSNPVILLDEIDKLGRDGRSDPSAALLEVLDPAQNCAFTDHYINTPFDLSRVLFVATANSPAPIPPAVLDRMEIIEMTGYVLDEKLQIARKHLLPRQLECNGLSERSLELPEEAIAAVAEGYTREAGVRNLEREIASICRWVAVKVAQLPAESRSLMPTQRVSPPDLTAILGPRKFEHECSERLSRPGVAMGLAWTAFGGELLFIEASRMGGTGELILTGQLGEVMRESVRTALSWICTHAESLGLIGLEGAHPLRATDLHVHFPAAATPKDGPSAGVTVLAALVSLLTGRLARPDTAMSGEVSLRGHVLPVGGVREKVIAAHRAGIRRIILPAANQKDLHDVSAKALEQLSFVFVRSVDDALEHALLPLEHTRSLELKGVDVVKGCERDDASPEEGYLTCPHGSLPLLGWINRAVEFSSTSRL